MNNAVILLEMRKRRTSHLLHLVLSIFTGGLWVFIWALCTILNMLHNAELARKIDKIQDMEAGA